MNAANCLYLGLLGTQALGPGSFAEVSHMSGAGSRDDQRRKTSPSSLNHPPSSPKRESFAFTSFLFLLPSLPRYFRGDKKLATLRFVNQS